MRKVTSREYKLILDHRCFRKPERAAAKLLKVIKELAKPLGVKTAGDFNLVEHRTITFLDTKNFALRHSNLVLRRRVEENGEPRYTLKCRTPDRYIADGIDLTEGPGLKGDDKFEEDIGLPFVSRFSHSNTVAFKNRKKAKTPKSLGEAGDLFPCLLELGRRSKLRVVNNVEAFEQVLTGPTFVLDTSDKTRQAEVALILWSDDAGERVRLAEFSFRYKDKKENFPLEIARTAKELYERLQQMDWSKPDAMTKTEYVYRTG